MLVFYWLIQCLITASVEQGEVFTGQLQVITVLLWAAWEWALLQYIVDLNAWTLGISFVLFKEQEICFTLP